MVVSFGFRSYTCSFLHPFVFLLVTLMVVSLWFSSYTCGHVVQYIFTVHDTNLWFHRTAQLATFDHVSHLPRVCWSREAARVMVVRGGSGVATVRGYTSPRLKGIPWSPADVPTGRSHLVALPARKSPLNPAGLMAAAPTGRGLKARALSACRAARHQPTIDWN